MPHAPQPLHLGIDASNIRQGGGVTHLSQLLAVHFIRRLTGGMAPC